MRKNKNERKKKEKESKMRKTKVLGVLGGIVAALSLSGMSFANGSADRLKGQIEAIGSSSLSVLGETILVSGTTKMENQAETHIPFSNLKVGDTVKVEGGHQSDGSILATKIELDEAEQEPQEVEIRASIDSIGSGSLVVSGMTVIAGSTTAIMGNDNQPIGFDDLHAGQMVQVEGALQGDGSILASKIKLEDSGDDDSLRLRAEIEKLDDSSMGVLRHHVLIDSSTELRGKRNEPISFADLQLGAYTTVDGKAQPDGSVRAIRVEADVTPSKGGQELRGKISAKGSNFIKVRSTKFFVRASTKIEDAAGEPMAFSGLRVGMRVRVEYRKSGSTFIAKEINVL